MKRKLVRALLTLGVLVGASLKYTPSAASNPMMPFFVLTLDVDRTDDTAAASACTPAPNDCSLRGAVIAANADPSTDPAVISLQPATTYNLTLTNVTQENAAATGDLDITTSLHTVTIVGGGSSGPNASVIDAAGLNVGTTRDRVFQVTGSGVNVTFHDLVIQNGQAADDGVSGVSTNPAAQNGNRAGGGILNNGGSVALENVTVRTCVALGKGDSVVNQHTTLEAHGGGLASLTATGNVNITDSTFMSDTALGGNGGNFNIGNGPGAKGGSVYFEGGTLNINGSLFEASSAVGGDGGDAFGATCLGAHQAGDGGGARAAARSSPTAEVSSSTPRPSTKTSPRAAVAATAGRPTAASTAATTARAGSRTAALSPTTTRPPSTSSTGRLAATRLRPATPESIRAGPTSRRASRPKAPAGAYASARAV